MEDLSRRLKSKNIKLECLKYSRPNLSAQKPFRVDCAVRWKYRIFPKLWLVHKSSNTFHRSPQICQSNPPFWHLLY